jgi:MoaA/NifB/PqqE/SkfB family radical SAM enzyme
MKRALRVLRSVIQNRTGAVPPRPSWCTYLVTYRCNARCGMCDSWRMKPGAEMMAGEVDAVFAKIGALDVVRITGGEPFLRGDLLDLARAIQERSRPLVMHVTTNGSLPEEVESFARRFSGRLQVMVSFDGMEEEHDRSRGPEVTFAKAMETVRRLAALGIPVQANHTVVSPRSIEENEELRRTLEPLGVDVGSVLAYESSAMYGLKLRGKRAEHLIVPRGYPLHRALHGADTRGFVRRELARIGSVRRGTLRAGKRYYLRGLLARLEGKAAHRPPCVALRSHIRLLPDGRVPVCQFNTEVIGELRARPFDEVWSGEEARASRAWVDACPGCWAECEVIPSAIYSGEILRGVL